MNESTILSSITMTELSQRSITTPNFCSPRETSSNHNIPSTDWPGGCQDPRKTMELHSPPSQPIPINNSCHSTQQKEENDSFAVSSFYYDHATWRMYTRIITARHLRDVSRGHPNHRKAHVQIMKSYYNSPPLALEYINAFHPKAFGLQPNADEDSSNDFVLEM